MAGRYHLVLTSSGANHAEWRFIKMKLLYPSPPIFRWLTLGCLAFSAIPALAQNPTTHDADVYDAFANRSRGGRGASQVTISPDGNRVAWVGPPPDGKGSVGVWTMPIAGGPATQLHGEGFERAISWSPDGLSISLVSGRGAEGVISIVPAAGGPARKVLTFKGQLGEPVWAPDGKSLAFLAIENPKRTSGATQPFKPQTGEVGSEPDVQRLAVVDAASGAMHWASPANMYVYEFGWSPDSHQIAVTAAAPPGENNWWTAKLYAADVTTGTLRLIVTPDFQINLPRWSPSGKWIAYVGGLMSDFGSIGGDVYVVAASGNKLINLTAGHKASANSIRWMQDESILIGETMEGETAFELLDAATGKLKPLDRQAAAISGPEGRNTMALSKDELSVAYSSATLTHGAEIFAGPIGRAKQLTHWSDGATADWGKIESIHWKNGKFDVQGWLVAPTKVEPGKKYPMIVQVHGGPASAVIGSWGLGQQAALWSQNGYYVFMPNPRGSFGEGEEFTKANRKDFGYGDWQDVMAGVDKVIHDEPVDANRLGLTGGSYGGFMTMWGVTQTTRFKSAIALAGIANWQSYYGENSIDEWMIPYFGTTVYDDPKVYAKSSPIEFIKRVKTPTLVIVGEYDGECPPPQSYEFWHALDVLKIKTELIVYPGEGHGVRSPENRRDLMIRELAWFNYYLK